MKGKGMAFAVVFMILAVAVFVRAESSRNTSRTAYSTMAFRAIGAQDPDPKTRNPDYLAERLCSPIFIYDLMNLSLVFEKAVDSINKDKSWMFYQLTARTKHIDAALVKAVGDGVKQVVILGAGFDTRAYRFHEKFPKIRFFEVDLPAMISLKKKEVRDKLCKAPSTVIYVPMDFEKQDLGKALAGAGYRKDLKTLFIWEGVAMYLKESAVASTLRFVAKNSAPGSLVIFDYLLPEVVDGTSRDEYAQELSSLVASFGEPFKWGMKPSDMAEYLKKNGLNLVSNPGPEEMVKLYMTGSNGKPLGTLPSFFWMATARVPKAR